MPLRSSNPVNVDEDDGINNNKPTATEPNEFVHLVGDAIVNSRTTIRIRKKKTIIISNDGNENWNGFVVVVVDDDGGGGDNELSVSVDVDDDIVVYW